MQELGEAHDKLVIAANPAPDLSEIPVSALPTAFQEVPLNSNALPSESIVMQKEVDRQLIATNGTSAF